MIKPPPVDPRASTNQMDFIKNQQRGGLEEILDRPQPSRWSLFWRAPVRFLATAVYSKSRETFSPDELGSQCSGSSLISVVCVSDTHNSQPMIPHADLLIHAGDLTQSGSLQELQAQLDWLNSLPHQFKIVVAGNHDTLLDASHRDYNTATQKSINWGSVIYLQDSTATVDILRTDGEKRQVQVYGSPYSAAHGNWAFQYPRSYGSDVWREKQIPYHLDILITHGPPRAHLDLGHLGCKDLLDEIWRKKPTLHVFGHVHEGYGIERVCWDRLQRAYEAVLVNGAGLGGLLSIIWESLKRYWASRQTTNRSVATGTRAGVMVNAAMVGGLRDEKRRRPIIVHI